MKKNTVFFLVCSVLFFCSCDSGESHENRITVSILPQKYFVERIAGDKFTVNVMVPPGYNPETYELTPQQMIHLSKSQIYFRIGHLPFENAWRDKIAAANPNMRIVDTSKGVELIQGDCEHGSHSFHGGVDPHIWVSPKAARVQAQNIYETLRALDPANSGFYEGNYRKFMGEIEKTDREIGEILANVERRKFLVYHPAWGYFARDYRLEQIAIEREGKEPSAMDVKEIIEIARREKIRVIFVQQQFDIRNAETIARAIDGRIVQIDPLAPDWVKNMKDTAYAFQDALK